jgi:phospholipid transport system substrate-binding protein
MVRALKKKAFVIVFATLLALGGAHSSRAGTSHPDPLQLIRGIGDSILSLLNGRTVDYVARREGFRATYRANFDTTGIVFAVAGPAYWKASSDQRRQLFDAFEDYIVTVYANKLGRYYAGEKLLVLRSDVDGDITVVLSVLISGDVHAQGVEIAWRLVNVGGSLRIRDVIIDKISVLLSLRREFASLLNQQDGDVDALVMALRRKTTEVESERAGSHPPARATRIGR